MSKVCSKFYPIGHESVLWNGDEGLNSSKSVPANVTLEDSEIANHRLGFQ